MCRMDRASQVGAFLSTHWSVVLKVQQEHLAFSPDGTWLGLATAKGELRLWHAPPFRELAATEAQP